MAVVPKRAEERTGHRTKAELAVDKVDRAQHKVVWQKARDGWSDTAKEVYAAYKKSPQSQFYVQSDVAILRALLDDLTDSDEVDPSRRAAYKKVIYSGLNDLLGTEGARRRLAIEVATQQAAIETTEDKVWGLIQGIQGGGTDD